MENEDNVNNNQPQSEEDQPPKGLSPEALTAWWREKAKMPPLERDEQFEKAVDEMLERQNRRNEPDYDPAKEL